MRFGRTATAGLLAGVLALSLVAADTTAAPGVGTASTRLLGAEVTVTGPLATPAVRVLDVVSSATTDGTPVASTSVVPLAVGDQQLGATSASSSGSTSGSSGGAGYGDLLGPLGVSVNPLSTSATATADRALATVSAATSEVDALLGAVGLDIDTTGVSSLATRDGSAATQGIQVSALDLGLGDLGLDADLLGTLGLDQVLALLAALPGLLPADLVDTADVYALLDDLDDALATLDNVAATFQDAIAQLTSIETALPDVEFLDTLLASLEGLDTAVLATLVTDLGALGTDLTTAGCTLPALNVGNVLTALSDAVACVTGALDTASADLTADGVEGLSGDGTLLLDELTTLSSTLAGLLPDEADAVLAAVDAVVAAVQAVLDALGGLDGLLDLLPDLLADAAGTDLLSVGAFDVGTTAVAGESVDDSSAVVLCGAVDVTVLGETFSTPDCSDAIAQLPDVTGAITGALGGVVGVLNSLPLADAVSVGDLRAELFGNLVESVSEADGVVTATAGVDILDLAIPTVTIDPSQITDTLTSLGLPDLTAVTDLLDDLSTELGVLDGLGVSEATALVTQVNDAITAAGAPDGLTDLVTQVTTLVDGLDVGDLGSLVDEVQTPGLELLIDPVSTATFAAGAAGGTPTPAPSPTPAPTPEPTLPATGGGLALLGVLALAGAGALRRRR